MRRMSGEDEDGSQMRFRQQETSSPCFLQEQNASAQKRRKEVGKPMEVAAKTSNGSVNRQNKGFPTNKLGFWVAKSRLFEDSEVP